MTIDENWGTKSFQIMDYIDVNHPSYTADMFRSYAINANVTVELKYTDGTPCDLKLVMQPSDIDVVGDTGANEIFSLINVNSTIDSIVMNNRNIHVESTSGNKITWNPVRGTSGPDQEKNLAGFAVKSKSNSMTFESTSAATSGSLFGVYTEAIISAPVKAVDPEQAPAKAGETITYTGTFTLPRQGIDTIDKIKSMSMVDTFDKRLDFQSLTVSFDGQTLTEGTDYTVAVDGQKVTVNIKDHLLTKANGGKKFVITYMTVTNSKVETDGSNIDNELTQVVDGNVAHSNKVTTELLYEKTHEFVSGTPNRELPQKVLDNQGNSIDGNKVTAGQVLTYSVTYTNTTNTARDVTITDVIPEHTTYVDGSADNDGTYDPATRTVTWTQNVASGDTLIVTFQVKVNKGEKDVTVVNAVHVSNGLIDTDTNTTTNPVVPKPRKSRTPYTGEDALQNTLMFAIAGGAAVLFALGTLKIHAARN